MVSRDDREAMVEVINQYLNEDLTAFKLDEALSGIGARTKDETVKQVGNLFWYHYDDLSPDVLALRSRVVGVVTGGAGFSVDA